MSYNPQLVSQYQQKGVYIAQFKVNMLAVFTYYIESNKEAYLIDPTYDYIIFQNYIEQRGATLKYVVLTHYHADFIAGHTEFNVPIIMGPGSKTKETTNFELIELKDNEKFKVGNVQTRVISTPGHTLESSCFILENQEGKQICIFTGDTVFIKELGRPDLASNSNITIQDLAAMLFDSIQKIKALDGSLRLYPGHGSGSACGKSIGPGNFCSLEGQKKQNYGFLIEDKSEFVQKLTQGIQAPPRYFFYDASMNQTGPTVRYEDAFKKALRPLSLQQVETYQKQGVAIIDTRHIPKKGIIKGSHWVTASGGICQLIAHVIEPETEYILIADEEKREEVIQRFIRVGFSKILGYNAFDMDEWKGELVNAKISQFQQLDKQKKQAFIDVRNKSELIETGMFEGALFVPITQFKSRIDEVIEFVKKNDGKEIVVQCKSGMRARLCAGILLNNGFGPVTVFNEVIDKVKEKGAVLVPFEEK